MKSSTRQPEVLRELVEGLAKARAEGVDAGQMAGAALRHFMLLDELRAAVDAGVSPTDAVNGARPPVFFKRKGKMETALGLWPPLDWRERLSCLATRRATRASMRRYRQISLAKRC